jgi:formiminotetrahydrofolate cyclodeaminase
MSPTTNVTITANFDAAPMIHATIETAPTTIEVNLNLNTDIPFVQNILPVVNNVEVKV